MKKRFMLNIGRGGVANRFLPNVRGERILDLGFADISARVHREICRLNPRSLVVGLDINLELIKRSGFNDAAILGDASCLPFRDASFDTVYMGEIIEHFRHPRKAILEAHRVLERGRRLCLTTPHVYHLTRILNYLARGRDSLVSPAYDRV